MKFDCILPIIAFVICSCQSQDGQKDAAASLPTKIGQSISHHNSCKILDGKIYTYLPTAEKETHLFTLKFECVRDTLRGLMLGPLPEGDHGLAFYRAQVNLVLDDSSNVSFVMVPGKLYEEQITLENYKDNLQDFGIDRGEQFFKGEFLADTALVLKCSSEFYDCYTKEDMIFKVKR